MLLSTLSTDCASSDTEVSSEKRSAKIVLVHDSYRISWLGRMGLPMAARLASVGHDVVAWNRTAGRSRALDGVELTEVRSSQSAVSGREVVITMLSDSVAVRDVIGGVTLEPGTTLIEMSTIGPGAVRQLREGLPDRVELVDAPVLGSVPQAVAGDLHIFAGGNRRVVDTCGDVLRVLGEVEYCGDSGFGAAMKLVVNAANICAMVVLGEALGLAHTLGIDRGRAADALARTALGGVSGAMRTRIAHPDSLVMFTVALAEESTRLITDVGVDEQGMAAGAFRKLRRSSAAGLATRDVSAALRWMADGEK